MKKECEKKEGEKKRIKESETRRRRGHRKGN